MAQKIMLTYAGLKKYEDELHDLKVIKRKEIAERIGRARAQGDLSENAEYDAAMDEQGEMESRIAELEAVIQNAEIVTDEELDLRTINVGCEVDLFDLDYDEEVRYSIVGTTEANSLKGLISNESPVGKALMGHTIGDVVEVATPSGEPMRLKVLDIRKIG